jgi:4,5-DOPA dioxygenase extradiol
MNNRFPSLFISHGAPTYALEPGLAGKQLGELGAQLLANGDAPSAILIVSPHWQSPGFLISANPKPETIYDFSGFPKALQAIRYPARGAPEVAARAFDLLKAAGIRPQIDTLRGIDHGVWVPLMHLFPRADIPVFQVSMPTNLNVQTAYEFGQLLSPLRDEGVLIIGSGSLTHNLYEIQWNRPEAAAYAIDFVNYVHEAVRTHDHGKLIDAIKLAPGGLRAHPTSEHYLPLLIAAGAGGVNDDVDIDVGCLPGGIEHHVLSMESYLFDVNARPGLIEWKM